MNIHNIHSAVLLPLYFNTNRIVEHFLQSLVLSMSNKFQNECNIALVLVLSNKILSLSGLDRLTIVSCGYMIICCVYITYIIASIWKIYDNLKLLLRKNRLYGTILNAIHYFMSEQFHALCFIPEKINKEKKYFNLHL